MTAETSTTSATSLEAGVQTVAEGGTPTGQAPSGVDTGAVGGDPAGAAAADAAAAEAKAAADAAALEYTIDAPEGVTLDETRLGEFMQIAKELKLPKDAAQKLAEFEFARVKAEGDARVKMANDWAETVKADKELGGDKLTETLATAKKALDLGPPELKELLISSGFGNHPAVVRWAYTIGKSLSESTFIPGNTPPGGPKDASRVLYPNNA